MLFRVSVPAMEAMPMWLAPFQAEITGKFFNVRPNEGMKSPRPNVGKSHQE
jgi:hypothetical protein